MRTSFRSNNLNFKPIWRRQHRAGGDDGRSRSQAWRNVCALTNILSVREFRIGWTRTQHLQFDSIHTVVCRIQTQSNFIPKQFRRDSFSVVSILCVLFENFSHNSQIDNGVLSPRRPALCPPLLHYCREVVMCVDCVVLSFWSHPLPNRIHWQ